MRLAANYDHYGRLSPSVFEPDYSSHDPFKEDSAFNQHGRHRHQHGYRATPGYGTLVPMDEARRRMKEQEYGRSRGGHHDFIENHRHHSPKARWPNHRAPREGGGSVQDFCRYCGNIYEGIMWASPGQKRGMCDTCHAQSHSGQPSRHAYDNSCACHWRLTRFNKQLEPYYTVTINLGDLPFPAPSRPFHPFTYTHFLPSAHPSYYVAPEPQTITIPAFWGPSLTGPVMTLFRHYLHHGTLEPSRSQCPSGSPPSIPPPQAPPVHEFFPHLQATILLHKLGKKHQMPQLAEDALVGLKAAGGILEEDPLKVLEAVWAVEKDANSDELLEWVKGWLGHEENWKKLTSEEGRWREGVVGLVKGDTEWFLDALVGG